MLVALNTGPTPHAADYASTVQSFNPIAYWRFSETATVPPAMKAANAGSLGEAGSGYGVLDVTTGEPGMVGNAARFVNTGWTVGYCGSKIDVSHNPALNPDGSFTAEFWAKPTSLVTDFFSPLASISTDANSTDRSGWLFYMTSANKWLFRIGGTGSYSGLAEGGVIQPNQWQHVVGVYDAATKTVSVYVNGQLVNGPVSAAGGNGFSPNTVRNFRIGGSTFNGNLGSYAGNRGFDGWLDEVALYNGVLSDERIAAHYNVAINDNANYATAVLADNPVGYWRLDEPAYTLPDPSTFPAAANEGSAGAAARGTYQPGTTAGIDGPPFSGLGPDNKAASLSGVVGQIAVPDAEALDFTGPVTLMGWVRPTSAGTMRSIVAHGPGGGSLFLRINAGNYEMGGSDGTTETSAKAPVPAGDVGNWVFLAGTWDASTGWRLYRYDTLIAEDLNGYGAWAATSEWAIGSRGKEPSVDFPAADGWNYGGGVDEVAIFDRALTASQIASIYSAAKATPIITSAPTVPSQVFQGDSLTLEVAAEGTPPLTYQWTKDGTALPGRTSSALTLNNVTSADSGTYAVEVTNPNGTTVASVELTVLVTPPALTLQPAGGIRFAGASVTFSVVATGSAPLSYQWKFNGAPIGGATAPNYVLASAQAADAGDYTCTVGNSVGELTSEVATLTVRAVPEGYAPVVVADSPRAYWRLGEASGAVAYDYWGGLDAQYQGVTLGQPGFSFLDPDLAAAFGGVGKYVGGISGTALDYGNPSATFTLEAWVKGPPAQVDGAGIIAKGIGPDGAGGFRGEQFCLGVVGGVYNFFVVPASDTAVVTECAAIVGPNGSWQHVVGVYDGSSGLMSVYVNGAISASTSVPASGPIASAHPVSIGSRRGGVDPSYDLYFNGTIDEVAVYNTVLPDDRILAHFEAQYGIGQAPVIQVQPVSITTYVGLPAKLTVAVAGSQPLTYQWKRNGANVAGATTDTLNFEAVTAANAGRYTVVIDNPVGSATSEEAVLTVLPIPTAPVEIPDLVAHWKFENNLLDDTGRGNSGTAQTAGTPGIPISYVDGKIGGKALHYETDAADTANVRSGYVTLGVRPDLQFGADQDFSVAFWVRLPLNYIFGDLPFICNALNSANNPGYTFAPSYGPGDTGVPGSWGWSLFSTSGGGGINVYGEIGAINDGNWHHIVHSFDRQGLGITYLNGVVVHSTLITSIGNLDTGRPTSIGQDPEGKYPESGQADLDDIGIFRRALSQLEATSIYAAGLNGHSFVNKAPVETTITVQTLPDGTLRLQWDGGGTLHQADLVTGAFEAIAGASSPYAVTPAGSQRFYLVK